MYNTGIGENFALSIFVGAELNPRGHGLSNLKP
jgi:hypothetical protein